jgi:site-specific DNA-methyltransferase (adenine-specific)
MPPRSTGRSSTSTTGLSQGAALRRLGKLTPYVPADMDKTIRTKNATIIGDCVVYTGDALRILRDIPRGSVDLIFADPPFNIGYKYDSYQDTLSPRRYVGWCEDWLYLCREVIRSTGSIVVASGLLFQAEIKCAMDRMGWVWRNTICWHYTFGPRQVGNFTPSWVALHYAVADRNLFTFNPEPVHGPSARQAKYNDRRAKEGGKVPDNCWVLFPNEYKGSEELHADGQPVCFGAGANAMLESRVCGTFKERTAHPCQMPEAIMDRLILALTNEGDTVLDPFAGSGTTLVSALKHKRRAIGIESSEGYVNDIIIPRVQSL